MIGKTLKLRSPFKAKTPTPVDHYVAPEPPRRDLDQLSRADQALAEQERRFFARHPEDRAEVTTLHATHNVAVDGCNQLLSEDAALGTAPPKDADRDARADWRRGRAAVDDDLPAARALVQETGAALAAKIQDVRTRMLLDAEDEGGVVREQLAEARDLHEQAEALHARGRDIELAAGWTRSKINSWLLAAAEGDA